MTLREDIERLLRVVAARSPSDVAVEIVHQRSGGLRSTFWPRDPAKARLDVEVDTDDRVISVAFGRDSRLEIDVRHRRGVSATWTDELVIDAVTSGDLHESLWLRSGAIVRSEGRLGLADGISVVRHWSSLGGDPDEKVEQQYVPWS